MTPTLLITGRNGQLAFELRRTLAPVANVIAVGTDTLDFSDHVAVRRSIQMHRPDIIVNAAAYTAVDRAETERNLAHHINTELPGVLARELNRIGGKLMVHYSTDYVFDGSATHPYTESAPTAPCNAYGESKLAGERAVQEAGGVHLVLRTEWVYGTRGANFMLTILRLARQGKPLRIIADQIGAPTWARMLAEASAHLVGHCMRLSNSEAGSLSGVYHLTAAGETTWHGFASEILNESLRRLKQLNKPMDWCEAAISSLTAISTQEYPLPARRPAYSVLSNDKVFRSFGIRLPHWREQLHLALEAYDFSE
jgi:dTDP-4-dehydrorhamnose reductase